MNMVAFLLGVLAGQNLVEAFRYCRDAGQWTRSERFSTSVAVVLRIAVVIAAVVFMTRLWGVKV